MVVAGLDRPDVEMHPHGLGWRVIMEGRRVRVTVTKLKRSSTGLRGYIEIDYARPKADGGGQLLLAGENLNLGDGRARTSLANRLSERVAGIAWRNVLDAVCIGVQHKDDEGEPVVLIGNRPRPLDGGWLVTDFLEHRQNHSLFGDGDVGKSWVALAMGVSAATGEEIIPGFRPVRRVMPLYVDYETDAETLERRVQMIARGAGIAPPDVPYLRLDQPFSDCLDRVMTVCQEHDVGLVIVDSVEAAMAGSADPGAGANEGPARMNQALRRLARTTLLVDHINAASAGQKGLAGKAYGSIFKRNWVRLAFELKRVREKSPDAYEHLGLFCQKRNNGPRFEPIGLQWQINDELTSWAREEILEGELTEALPPAQRIHACLRMNGPSQPSTIREETGLPQGTVTSTLSRRHDLFEKNAAGLWVAKAVPDEAPPDDFDFGAAEELPWPE